MFECDKNVDKNGNEINENLPYFVVTDSGNEFCVNKTEAVLESLKMLDPHYMREAKEIDVQSFLKNLHLLNEEFELENIDENLKTPNESDQDVEDKLPEIQPIYLKQTRQKDLEMLLQGQGLKHFYSKKDSSRKLELPTGSRRESSTQQKDSEIMLTEQKSEDLNLNKRNTESYASTSKSQDNSTSTTYDFKQKLSTLVAEKYTETTRLQKIASLPLSMNIKNEDTTRTQDNNTSTTYNLKQKFSELLAEKYSGTAKLQKTTSLPLNMNIRYDGSYASTSRTEDNSTSTTYDFKQKLSVLVAETNTETTKLQETAASQTQNTEANCKLQEENQMTTDRTRSTDVKLTYRIVSFKMKEPHAKESTTNILSETGSETKNKKTNVFMDLYKDAVPSTSKQVDTFFVTRKERNLKSKISKTAIISTFRQKEKPFVIREEKSYERDIYSDALPSTSKHNDNLITIKKKSDCKSNVRKRKSSSNVPKATSVFEDQIKTTYGSLQTTQSLNIKIQKSVEKNCEQNEEEPASCKAKETKKRKKNIRQRFVRTANSNVQHSGDLEDDMETQPDDHDVLTGMFDDGLRRIDFVLVTRADVNPDVEDIKRTYLTGLAKLGIDIEMEAGVLKHNRHLQFIKLHASDVVLITFAERFGVQKYFKEIHEQYIDMNPSFLDKLFRYPFEREWLRRVRRDYKKPLNFSFLDRSYIVYMILRYQSFGEPSNYFGLHSWTVYQFEETHIYQLEEQRKADLILSNKRDKLKARPPSTINYNYERGILTCPHCAREIAEIKLRLLARDIFVDAYALHDGPYFIGFQKNLTHYNCRQILYLTWIGITNVCRYQPLNMIYEYFGSKLAFYFAFFGFYNRILFFISLWGWFVKYVLYTEKDHEYLGYLKYSVKDESPIMQLICAECDRQGGQYLCPFSRNTDDEIEYRIIRDIDSPYVILYSVGVAFWALLFLAYWKRTECYWSWMWEETEERETIRLETVLREELYSYKVRRTWLQLFESWSQILFRRAIPNIVLSSLAVLFLALFMNYGVTAAYEFFRPLAMTVKSHPTAKTYENHPNKLYRGQWELPKYDLDEELLQLTELTGVMLLDLSVITLIFYILSYCTTVYFEKHKTHEQFEQSLSTKYFFYGFTILGSVVVYYAWVKAAFYNVPNEIWDVVFKIKTPWKDYSINMTEESEFLRDTLIRGITLNCNPFSCFRQATMAYVSIIVFLAGVPIATGALRRIYYKPRLWTTDAMPTCEREHELRPVSEHQVMYDLNVLLVQFAFVILFAPLYPWGPSVVFLVNLLYMREQARMYITRTRRAILFKTRGIAHWNFKLKLICYSVPLFHATSIIRTEIFKKYIFYKFRRTPTDAWVLVSKPNASTDELFRNFLLTNNYQMFPDQKGMSPNPALVDLFITKAVYMTNASHRSFYMTCTFDGIYSLFNEQSFYMADKNSGSAPYPEHYYMKYLKIAFILVYVHLFAFVAILMWRYVRACPPAVARVLQRERTLRRMLKHHRDLLAKRTAATELNSNIS